MHILLQYGYEFFNFEDYLHCIKDGIPNRFKQLFLHFLLLYFIFIHY
jgi:hypothetical protein